MEPQVSKDQQPKATSLTVGKFGAKTKRFRSLKYEEDFKGIRSVTIPDETMSIKEIMSRHLQRAADLDRLRRPGGYDAHADLDSEDLEKLKHMDMVDRDESLKRFVEKDVQRMEHTHFLQTQRDPKPPARRGSDTEGGRSFEEGAGGPLRERERAQTERERTRGSAGRPRDEEDDEGVARGRRTVGKSPRKRSED